jgi:DNA-binding response OmpR family regulator
MTARSTHPMQALKEFCAQAGAWGLEPERVTQLEQIIQDLEATGQAAEDRPVASQAEPATQPAPATPSEHQEQLQGQLEHSLREYNRTLEVSQRILLVDDDPAAQQELTETMAQHGLLADLATSGEEALERVAERKYAVLLAGLRLPDMDGIELMRSAHRLRPAMEAIICTRSSSLDEVIRAFDRGASDYLPKPYPSRPFISWKVRGALARYDFEVRAQAFIQFLKDSCEAQAKDHGHDLQTACVVPLKAALRSFQEEPGSVRIAMAAPVALVRVARKLGYETTQASGLGELLALVKQGEAQVVVAVEESGGIDGVELITRLWRADPDTGVFVIAPEKKLRELVQAIGTGIGDTLLRPLEGRELFGPRLGRLVVRQQRTVRYQRLLSALKTLHLDLMSAPQPTAD